MQESRLTSLVFGAALAVMAIWMGQPAVTERTAEATVVDARQAAIDGRQAVAVPTHVLDVGCEGHLTRESCTVAAQGAALGVAPAIEKRLDLAEELVQAGESAALNL